MSIRIRRHYKSGQETQTAGFEEVFAELSVFATACYADRVPVLGVLCGSAES